MWRVVVVLIIWCDVLGSVVEDVHCGPLSLPVAPAADDDRVAKDICRGGRAGARVGRMGDDVRASDGD